MMKKVFKYWRKPISLVLALCMLLSAMAVGLTVFAADVVENQTKAEQKSNPMNVDANAETELEIVTKWVNQYKNGSGDAKKEAEDWLYEKLIANFKIGYDKGLFKEQAGGFGDLAGGGTGIQCTGSVQDDAEGTAYNTLMMFQAIQQPKMVYAGTGGWNWLEDVRIRMTELFKSKMEPADFTNYGVETIVRFMSGARVTGDSNKTTNAYIFSTLPEAGKTYLTRYNSIDSMPNAISTSYGVAIAHKNFGNIFTPKWGFTPDWRFLGSNADADAQNITDNKRAKMPASDKTSKAALQNFQNVFTSDILNVSDVNNIASYSKEQFASIYDSGAAVLAGIAGMDKSVAEHFFRNSTDIYEEDAFTRATSIYNFVNQTMSSAYDNYNAKMTSADTTYADDVVLDFASLIAMKAELDSALVDYEMLKPEQQQENAIVASKIIYDKLLARYNADKKGIYQTEMPTKLNELYEALKKTVTVDGKEYKLSDFVNANSTETIYDSVPEQGFGFVRTATDLYLSVARIMIEAYTFSVDGLNGTAGLLAKIKSYMTDPDTLPDFDQAEWNAFGMEEVLKGLGQVNSTTGFTVTSNPLIYTYNNISEIPDDVLSSKTTYMISLNENGKITSEDQLSSKTLQLSDKLAKTGFSLWVSNFDEASRKVDLSTLYSTDLKIHKEKTRAAVNAIAHYDDMAKAHLLGNFGYTFAEGQARADAAVKAINDKFNKEATAFIAKYGKMSELSDQAAYDEFFVLYDEAVALYDLIGVSDRTPAIEKFRTDIENLRRFLSDMKEYMDACKEMEKYYVSGTTTLVPFTSKTIVTAKVLLGKMNEIYKTLTERSLAYDEVKEAKKLNDKFSVAVNAYFTNPVWEQTSISYDGVENATAENLQRIIKNLDAAIGSDMIGSLLNVPAGEKTQDYLFNMITSALFTDALPNTIIKMFGPEVLKAAGDNAGAVGIVGLYVYPNTVSSQIGDYPQVKAALNAAGQNWDAINWDNMIWTTTDKKTGKVITIEEGGQQAFVQAIGSALKPFWRVIKALMNNDPISIIIIGELLAGYPGLLNVVFPMFKQLGIGLNKNNPNQAWDTIYSPSYTLPNGTTYGNNYKTPQDFVSLKDDSYQFIGNLLTPLFSWLYDALGNPVETVAKVLPTLSYMLSANKIAEGLYKLTGPLGTSIVDGLTSTMDLSNINNLIKGFMPDGLVLPNGVSIKLPEIDQGLLAGLATKQNITAVGNKDISLGYSKAFNGNASTNNMTNGAVLDTSKTYDQVVFYLLQYVVTLLKDNKAELASLVGAADSPIAKMLTTILDKDTNTILNTFIGLFLDLGDIENVDWSMNGWKDVKTTDVNYGTTTNKKVKQAIEQVDILIKVVAKELLSMDTSKLVGDNLYTNDNLNNLVMTIFRMLGTDQISPLLGYLGIDVSVSAVATYLEPYGAVSAYLKNAQSWETVDLTGLDWGLNPNSSVSMSNQFATAIARIFKSFNPLLKTLIYGEDFPLLGGLITLKGADGYSNGILPILRAFGAAAKSTEEYRALVASQGDDAMLVGIIAPVLDKVEQIANAPVDTLANMLPNLGYFLDNGGMTKAINGLLLPITNVTDQLLPLLEENGKTPTLIDVALTLVGNSLPENIKTIVDKIDFDNLDASLLPVLQTVLSNLTIGDATLSIDLPDFKWGNVAGLGERKSDNGIWQTTKSKIAGDPTTYHIEADTGATVMTVMNYLFKTVKANQDTIVQLLSGIELGNLKDTVLDLVMQVLANEPETMTSAIINVLTIDSPADDDWDMKDFAFNTSSKLYKNEDERRIAESVVKSDLLINNVTSKFLLDGGTLKNVIKGLYSDDTMKSLFSMIFTALDSEAITPIFDKIEIDVTPAALAKALAGMGNISAVIGNNATWAEVFASKGWATASFGVNDSDSLAKALAASLSPFESVLKAILSGKDFNVLNIYKIKGANGYKNSILPMLSALGVTAEDGALTAKEYAESIEKGDFSLYNIIKPVLNMATRMASSPVEFLTNMLPNLAYFMDNGGLTRSVYNLLKPLTNITDQLLPIFAVDGKTPTIQEFALKLLSEIAPDFALPEGLDVSSIETSIIPVINGILKTVKIGENPIGLTIPDIDWGTLAGRGDLKSTSVLKAKSTGEIETNVVVSNKQDVFVAVLNYVALIPTYADNKQAIVNLLGDSYTGIVAEIVDNLTSKKPVDLSAILVDLFSPTSAGLSRDWTFKVINALAPKYTANLSEEDFTEGIAAFDAMIPGLLASFAGGATVKSLVGNGVYTNNMVNTLAKAIFGNFASDEMETILDYVYELGIDISPQGVASWLVESKYKAVNNTLRNARGWSDVDFEKLSWGFKDGDQAGFLNSIVAMLRPVLDVLESLLTGKDFVALDTVTIRGGDGYNNAIIPLLEALQCQNIITEIQYKKAVQSNPDNLLLAIINPLFAKINELLDAPIGTLTSVLPSFAYFMCNDGLSQLIDSFLLPITKVLDSVAPIYDVKLNSILAPITQLDVVETVNGALSGLEVNGEALGITLPNFSWEKIAGFGQSVTFTSAQVDASGNRVTSTKIVANQPQAFAETLRYLVGIVQDPVNYQAITKLVGGLDLGSLQEVVVSLLAEIGTSDIDSVVEMLFSMLLGIGGEDDSSSTKKPTPMVSTTTATTTKPTTTQATTQQATTTKATTKAPVTQPAPVDEGNGANLPLIIGLSVGGVAIIAIAAAIIIIRKKRLAK